MSVVIKGMQMPENCTKCGLMCALRHFNILSDNRPDDCPLIELPEHHGRLIDADELEPNADYDDGEFWAYSITQVCNAQTIVEAE